MMIMITMQYNGDEENYDDNAYDDDADEDDYDDEYEDDFDLCAVIIKDDIEAGCWLLAPLKFYSSWEKISQLELFYLSRTTKFRNIFSYTSSSTP